MIPLINSPLMKLIYEVVRDNPDLTCDMISFKVKNDFPNITPKDRNVKVSATLYRLSKRKLITKSETLCNNMVRWRVI